MKSWLLQGDFIEWWTELRDRVVSTVYGPHVLVATKKVAVPEPGDIVYIWVSGEHGRGVVGQGVVSSALRPRDLKTEPPPKVKGDTSKVFDIQNLEWVSSFEQRLLDEKIRELVAFRGSAFVYEKQRERERQIALSEEEASALESVWKSHLSNRS